MSSAIFPLTTTREVCFRCSREAGALNSFKRTNPSAQVSTIPLIGIQGKHSGSRKGSVLQQAGARFNIFIGDAVCLNVFMATAEKNSQQTIILNVTFRSSCRFKWPRVLTAFPDLAQSADKS
jgi:hypothetical protein